MFSFLKICFVVDDGEGDEQKNISDVPMIKLCDYVPATFDSSSSFYLFCFLLWFSFFFLPSLAIKNWDWASDAIKIFATLDEEIHLMIL